MLARKPVPRWVIFPFLAGFLYRRQVISGISHSVLSGSVLILLSSLNPFRNSNSFLCKSFHVVQVLHCPCLFIWWSPLLFSSGVLFSHESFVVMLSSHVWTLMRYTVKFRYVPPKVSTKFRLNWTQYVFGETKIRLYFVSWWSVTSLLRRNTILVGQPSMKANIFLLYCIMCELYYNCSLSAVDK